MRPVRCSGATVEWRDREGDHDLRVARVAQRDGRVAVVMSWAERDGAWHEWAHLLRLRDGLIIDMEDSASEERALRALLFDRLCATSAPISYSRSVSAGASSSTARRLFAGACPEFAQVAGRGRRGRATPRVSRPARLGGAAACGLLAAAANDQGAAGEARVRRPRRRRGWLRFVRARSRAGVRSRPARRDHIASALAERVTDRIQRGVAPERPRSRNGLGTVDPLLAESQTCTA